MQRENKKMVHISAMDREGLAGTLQLMAMKSLSFYT